MAQVNQIKLNSFLPKIVSLKKKEDIMIGWCKGVGYTTNPKVLIVTLFHQKGNREKEYVQKHHKIEEKKKISHAKKLKISCQFGKSDWKGEENMKEKASVKADVSSYKSVCSVLVLLRFWQLEAINFSITRLTEVDLCPLQLLIHFCFLDEIRTTSE